MGEPIFSIEAHVFQIDPDTKKNWISSSSEAVSVSFYHDINRHIYRIISIEGSKILINCTVMPSMIFIKTSKKFGQWSDAIANTIYGLGFSEEQNLDQFIEAFNNMKAAASLITQEDNEVNEWSDSLAVNEKILPQDDMLITKHFNQADFVKKMTLSSDPSLSYSRTHLVEQLRYENDRLLVALTQSRTNAKKWEVELQTLRNNNLRLNAALVESASNVEQWKQQLTLLKEENIVLRHKLTELELPAENSEHFQNQLTEVVERLQMAERLVEDRNKELAFYHSGIDEISGKDVQRQILEKIQTVEEENIFLKKEIIKLNNQLEKANSGFCNNQELLNLQQQLGRTINEIYVLTDRLAELL